MDPNGRKTCRGCGKSAPIRDFVNLYGYANPRGKYCRRCHDRRELNSVREQMQGRNFCLYCGRRFSRTYDRTADGKFLKLYLHRDHMDPVAWGGEMDEWESAEPDEVFVFRNTVVCCADCNLRKGDMLFVDWLRTLKPHYRRLARKVYRDVHGHAPEAFKPERTERDVLTWVFRAGEGDPAPVEAQAEPATGRRRRRD